MDFQRRAQSISPGEFIFIKGQQTEHAFANSSRVWAISHEYKFAQKIRFAVF